MNKINIGLRIKEFRQEQNLSQTEFGKKLGVSQDTVSLWERGKGLPSILDIIKIIDVFSTDENKISADYLLGLVDL